MKKPLGWSAYERALRRAVAFGGFVSSDGPLSRSHVRALALPERSPFRLLPALGACLGLDNERAAFYADVVRIALGDAARAALEALMQSPQGRQFESEFARKYVSLGRTEGRAEGRAEEAARAVLAVLEARGLVVTAEQRDRIVACSDLETLESWVRRAVSVQSVQELFADSK